MIRHSLALVVCITACAAPSASTDIAPEDPAAKADSAVDFIAYACGVNRAERTGPVTVEQICFGETEDDFGDARMGFRIRFFGRGEERYFIRNTRDVGATREHHVRDESDARFVFAATLRDDRGFQVIDTITGQLSSELSFDAQLTPIDETPSVSCYLKAPGLPAADATVVMRAGEAAASAGQDVPGFDLAVVGDEQLALRATFRDDVSVDCQEDVFALDLGDHFCEQTVSLAEQPFDFWCEVRVP